MILGLRTDNPTTELYLLDSSGAEEGRNLWHSDRELSLQLNEYIDKLLTKNNLGYKDIEGVVVYRGPGSFTGLRIGITVANTLSHALNIPIVGTSGGEWLQDGVESIVNNPKVEQIIPAYGGEANITTPRK